MHVDSHLLNQICEVMAAAFGVDERELPVDASQETYSMWTSLNHLTLILALEEHFHMTFSMEDMQAMTSVPIIVAVLEHRGVT